MLEKCIERRGGQGATIDSGSLALPIKGETALEVSPFSPGFVFCVGGVVLGLSWMVLGTCGLMWALLEPLLDSFWLSWGALGPHFGALGAPWGSFLAQVSPSWQKTSIFEGLVSGFGAKVGIKNR